MEKQIKGYGKTKEQLLEKITGIKLDITRKQDASRDWEEKRDAAQKEMEKYQEWINSVASRVEKQKQRIDRIEKDLAAAGI